MTTELNSIYQYASSLSFQQSDLLSRLEKETHLKTLAPQMMSGHIQGGLLYMLASFLNPSHVLEIGTFTGYGTICLAEGMSDQGKIITIESKKEHSTIAVKYIDEFNADKNVINLIEGDALAVIPELDETFDMVFIDAGKREYKVLYDLVLPKIRLGGFILADNVLWSGKVLDAYKDMDTQSLHDFNEYVFQDNRVKNLILPVRDGVNIIKKIVS